MMGRSPLLREGPSFAAYPLPPFVGMQEPGSATAGNLNPSASPPNPKKIVDIELRNQTNWGEWGEGKMVKQVGSNSCKLTVPNSNEPCQAEKVTVSVDNVYKNFYLKLENGNYYVSSENRLINCLVPKEGVLLDGLNFEINNQNLSVKKDKTPLELTGEGYREIDLDDQLKPEKETQLMSRSSSIRLAIGKILDILKGMVDLIRTLMTKKLESPSLEKVETSRPKELHRESDIFSISEDEKLPDDIFNS